MPVIKAVLDKEILNLPQFINTRVYAVIGRGWVAGDDFQPTTILPLTVVDEVLQKASEEEILSQAETAVRDDLKKNFTGYNFSVNVFQFNPLPLPMRKYKVFVSAEGYTDNHRIRYSKIFVTDPTEDWDNNMNNILDEAEADIKRQLAGFCSMVGFGVDWTGFSCLSEV